MSDLTIEDFEDNHPVMGTMEWFRKTYPKKYDDPQVAPEPKAPSSLLSDFEKKYPLKYGKLPEVNMLKGPEGGELRTQLPEVSGAVKGFMGTAPDELGGSVLDEKSARERAGAELGYPVGAALQALPMAAGITAAIAPLSGGRAAQRGILGLGEALGKDGSTLKALGALPMESGMISRQALRTELNKPGIAGAEKTILSKYAGDGTGAIAAEDLVKAVRADTKNFELTPNHDRQWADYGLDQIGRVPAGPMGRQVTKDSPVPRNVRATVWQLPEGVSGNEGNHFKDPNYFGHTRAFEENGIPHVVEVQSDLMQHKPLEGAKRADAETKLQQAEWDLQKAHENNKGKTGSAERQLLQPIQLKIDELKTKLNAGVTSQDVAPMRKNHQQRLVRQELDLAAKNDQPVVRFATPDTVAKVEGWPNATQDAIARIKDAESKLPKATGGAAKQLLDIIANDKDILKNVRETRLGMANDMVAEAELKLKTATDRDFDKYTEELAKAKTAVSHYTKHLNDPIDAPLFSPEHHGIYDTYKELETYLRKIGGTDHTDQFGHTWIEVPVKGDKSPLKSGRMPLFTLTGAAAPAAYNATPEDQSK